MIEPQTWVSEVLVRLQEHFGDRLKYLGLQGSYRRGEAHEASDIDLVVLLDAVSLDDLDAYRAIVHAMPEGEKSCGFISGVKEFAAWPRHELFPFKMDTDDYYGKLDEFLPPIAKDDIQKGANISASVLVHALTHSYLYADPEARPAIMKEACKSAFFLMQVAHYLASGTYCQSKQELLSRLTGAEKEIIMAGMDFPAWLSAHSEKEAFTMLLEWCRSVMVASCTSAE